MLDKATGMKPGERYCVDNIERTHQFPGFFLDGKYYLGPELLTAVGWLEGRQFIYDSLDAQGDPVFPDRIAGTLDDLKLTLIDGTRLDLSRIEARATLASQTTHGQPQREPETALTHREEQDPSVMGGWPNPKSKAPLIIGAALLGLVAGLFIRRVQRKQR